MVSMRMARCSSPRPETKNVSGVSPSLTRSEMLRSSSAYRRSRSLREVDHCPSRPVNGEVLTEKAMRTVGSSTVIGGSASGCSGSAMVSPMLTSDRPMTATISPAAASSVFVRPSPSKTPSSATASS